MFAQDDWTTTDTSPSGQASPRDNVVFEAGLFGGALGIRRTFILHANGSKLPTDLLGLTSVRYDPAARPAEVRAINQKLRKAIETEGRRSPVEGLWWQLSLTARSEYEPSAVSLLRISRDRDGGLNVAGRAWQEDGTLSARYWSEAAKERRDPGGIFYFWKGERPRHPNAPQLEGTGEIRVETADRATGYWTTRSDRDPGLNARTSGIYLRADPSDLLVLDGGSEEERVQLIAQRLQEWKSAANRILTSRRALDSIHCGLPVEVSQFLVGLDRVEERQHALGEQCRSGGVVRRERGVGEEVLRPPGRGTARPGRSSRRAPARPRGPRRRTGRRPCRAPAPGRPRATRPRTPRPGGTST